MLFYLYIMYLLLPNNDVPVPVAMHEYIQMVVMSSLSSCRPVSTTTRSNVTGIYRIVTYDPNLQHRHVRTQSTASSRTTAIYSIATYDYNLQHRHVQPQSTASSRTTTIYSIVTYDHNLQHRHV